MFVITGDELKNSIERLKNRKLAINDRVHAEIMEEYGELGLLQLLEMCMKSWNKECVSKDCKKAVIVLLHKSKWCKNYI